MINYKRIMAVALTATMVMGSSTVAFAADSEGNLTGSGELEQLEATDVFDVKLPTIADGATTYNYILDPNGLIKESGTNGRFGDKTFEEGATLFFLNTTDKTDSKDYSKTSDKMTVINKSTQDVEITVKATVKSVAGVKMDADGTFGENGGNLYLALKDGTNTSAVTENGATLTSTIKKTDGVYKVKWDATKKKYVKELDSTKTDTDFQKYEFQLTGACKADTVWDTLKDTPPAVDVVWSVKDFTVTGPQISMNNDGLITMTGFTATQNYASLAVTDGEGTKWDIADSPFTWDLSNYNAETGGDANIQLSDGWISFLIEKGGDVELELTLTDGDTRTFTTTIS